MKLVYRFGGARTEGSARMKAVLGGKGANLAEMAHLGIPVPPGFTISAALCMDYLKTGRFSARLTHEVARALHSVEQATGHRFGDVQSPLLLSIRSGARVSMPGMMDSVLNLGLTHQTLDALAAETGSRRFALDCYRRFVQMFADVVLNVEHSEFEALLRDARAEQGVTSDAELSDDALAALVNRYLKRVEERTGRPFPQDPQTQLWQAISAVFHSWNTARAQDYRRLYRIPDHWGTAVNIQAMVFGNRGADSATGVCFTRNPATGAREFYGEYLTNAQGEDVVAGIRTPKPLAELAREMPAIYRELTRIMARVERHYHDMQDMEFTIEKGRLWILQTRTGKRAGPAAVRIAVELADSGLISRTEALRRVSADDVDQCLHPRLDPTSRFTVLATGLPGTPGAVAAPVVFWSEDAIRARGRKHPAILVRHQTSADDIAGMNAAAGFLTATGGMTSHAAVVARGMGKPCVVGCEVLRIDYGKRQFSVGATVVREGDVITIDGASGRVILGAVPTLPPSITPELRQLLAWADRCRRLGVRANADTPDDAAKAREFGAAGIGLCRTEHMFFGADRIGPMREMILAENEDGRRRALAKLLPMQREDFIGIFRAMRGQPVIIRTLDPPLHEFLPVLSDTTTIRELAASMAISEDRLRAKITELHEANPMLGLRGCRLGIAYPEITEMQARAIFEAACALKRARVRAVVEVMIPVVSTAAELAHQRAVVDRVAREVFAREKCRVAYKVGTMIEIPRAALTAGEIAVHADFFSFGTNDLTQTTFGFSRDDVNKFLPDYVGHGILTHDPFQRLDRAGVGQLMTWARQRGRRTRADLEVGICGEHGGDPSSVEFCHEIGLDYVSCSPFRVPIARLAAAHAALRARRGGRETLAATV